MLGLTDTHCHLDFDVFHEDRNQVIERAQEAGVHHLVNPGVDLYSSQQAVSLANQYPNLYAAVGVHPNDADTWDDTIGNEIRQFLTNDKVVAIGEIGLDYYRDQTLKDLQKKVFRIQLEYAAEFSLPVIIHSRQAMDDTLDILEEWQQSLMNQRNNLANDPGIMHSFEGNLNECKRAAQMNFKIGVGGPITFKNASMRRELVQLIALDHIVLETDSPFLAPDPHRGRRNEPAYIPLIADVVAELHDVPLSTVTDITTKNAARIFAWSF